MLSIQEMFDKAVRGLYKQGWAQAMDGGSCVYQAPDGKRCAWGHVDTGLTENDRGYVESLRRYRVGLAAALGDVHNGPSFATELQRAHDGNGERLPPAEMVMRLGGVAERYGLAWPTDVPKETV